MIAAPALADESYGIEQIVDLGSDGMHAVVLDTVTSFDEDPLLTNEQALDDLVKGTGIKYLVLNPSGPGGGWPIVLYVGVKDELYEFVTAHFGQ